MAEETKTPTPAPKAEPAKEAATSNSGGFTFESSRENFQGMTGIEHAEFIIKTIVSAPMFAVNSVVHAFKNQFGK